MKRNADRKTSYVLGALSGLMGVCVVVILVMTAGIDHEHRTAVTKRLAATRACQELMGGVDASLAALQSYVILGADTHAAIYHAARRRAAWERIDEALETLSKLASEWNGTRDARRWERLRPKLEPLRTAQAEVEKIAHPTPEESSAPASQPEPRTPTSQVLAKITTTLDQAREIKGLLTELIASQDTAADADRERAADADSLLTLTAILSGLVLIAAGALLYTATESAITASKKRKRAARISEATPVAVAMRGTVKFFNTPKGFGFIEPADGGDDVFFHQNDIPGLVVQEGDTVEFDVTQWEKGPRATNIKTIKAG